MTAHSDIGGSRRGLAGGRTAGSPGDDGKGQLVSRLADDLAAETAELVPLLAGLAADGWGAATPAAGWSVRDQVTHLAFFDDAALLSLRDREAFIAQRAGLRALGANFPDAVAGRHRHLPGADCLGWLTRSRARLIAAYRAADPAARLPWYGPDFSVPASLTGRLMETWAHGQDIADALGVVREPTARLRHIAHLGHRTLGYAFMANGKAAPTEPVRIELTAPGGTLWTFGPQDAANRVDGPALDFCRLVTKRAHRSDLGLTAHGPVADEWLDVAQAFAGPPGSGREPVGGPRS